MGRAPCCDKANVKKGPWSPEEDSKLKDYIDKHGTGGNWIALPQKAGLKRCGKSCRLRWLNYLRPNIKHGEFSDEEDRVICTLFSTIGSRWSIIAAQLPGRTDNDIKNYWNTKLKKKLMGMHNNMHAPPPSSSHHHHRKPPPFPFPSSSSISHHYHNYQKHPLIPSPPPLSSLTFSSGFELPPNISIPSSHFSNPTNNSSLFQPQHCLVGSIYHNNINNNYPHKKNNINTNVIMFGSEGSCCTTSSDGSCNQMKQEEIVGFDHHHQDQNTERFAMLNYGGHDNMMNQWYDDQRPNGYYFGGESNTLDYCGTPLEDVKQLISTISSSSNIINNNDIINGSNNNSSKSKSLLFNVDDENKTEEKVVYFC